MVRATGFKSAASPWCRCRQNSAYSTCDSRDLCRIAGHREGGLEREHPAERRLREPAAEVGRHIDADRSAGSGAPLRSIEGEDHLGNGPGVVEPAHFDHQGTRLRAAPLLESTCTVARRNPYRSLIRVAPELGCDDQRRPPSSPVWKVAAGWRRDLGVALVHIERERRLARGGEEQGVVLGVPPANSSVNCPVTLARDVSEQGHAGLHLLRRCRRLTSRG